MAKLQGKVMGGKIQLSEGFRTWAAEHDGARFEIVPYIPESSKMRRWFEGAVIPLICYYQEGMDYKNRKDLAQVREWLKMEFLSELVRVNDKIHKVADSSKGRLKELSERVLDWAGENGYQIELLVPDLYKKWSEEIYPYGGCDHFIDYLLETGKLIKR